MSGGVAIERLQAGDHVCWAFDDDANLRDTTIGFLRAGINAGDKVLCYLEELDPAELVQRLTHGGIDASSAVASGQAGFRSADESYLATGWFTPDQVIDGWRVELQRASDEGFPHLRVIADMSWAFQSSPVPGADRLTWYEARVNRVSRTDMRR